jgi:hypothetical protein
MSYERLATFAQQFTLLSIRQPHRDDRPHSRSPIVAGRVRGGFADRAGFSTNFAARSKPVTFLMDACAPRPEPGAPLPATRLRWRRLFGIVAAGSSPAFGVEACSLFRTRSRVFLPLPRDRLADGVSAVLGE